MIQRLFKRQFMGNWDFAWIEMQVHLLEMLAAYPQPQGLELRFSKALVSPDQFKRDFWGLHDVLKDRLGGKFSHAVVEGIPCHEIIMDCTKESDTPASKPNPDVEASLNGSGAINEPTSRKPRNRVLVSRKAEVRTGEQK